MTRARLSPTKPSRIKPPIFSSNDLAVLRRQVLERLHVYVAATRRPVVKDRLPLVYSSYDYEELAAALEVMLDGHMTMGERTFAFERQWAHYLGTAAAIMVNSGSSANLLATAALSAPDLHGGLRPGDEVIVPAVAWSTSIYPIVQLGAVPVLVDVDPRTFNVTADAIEAAIGPKTRAILVIHLLGNPCPMEPITALARRRGLWLLEDCCEAHGAAVAGQKVGTFGDLSTFSFFFSHHMTTIEGGAVCFQNVPQWHDRLVSLRAHGWIRGRQDAAQWRSRWPDIDPRWLFVSLGYNVRPTDLSAAFGLAQLSKLPMFVERRRAVRQQLLEGLQGGRWLEPQQALPGHDHSAFGFGLVVDPDAPFSRRELQEHLEASGVETRPIIGGNFARQPVMQGVRHRVVGSLAGADRIHHQGFMFGNHHDLTPGQVQHVLGVLRTFVRRHV